jgi:hypothetical protein
MPKSVDKNVIASRPLISSIPPNITNPADRSSLLGGKAD